MPSCDRRVSLRSDTALDRLCTTTNSNNNNERRAKDNISYSNRNMGPALSVLSCVPDKCWPSPKVVLETVSERTRSVPALSGVLKRRAMAPHMRVIGNSYGRFLEQESSPVLDRILEGIPNCEPGKTYIVVLKSQNGKTTAAMDVVANHLGGFKRNGLYLNAGRHLDIVPSLQKVLNTTVDGSDIVRALVSALGISQAGKNMAPSLLFLDEVNRASATDGEGLENASFVQDLFLTYCRRGKYHRCDFDKQTGSGRLSP